MLGFLGFIKIEMNFNHSLSNPLDLSCVYNLWKGQTMYWSLDKSTKYDYYTSFPLLYIAEDQVKEVMKYLILGNKLDWNMGGGLDTVLIIQKEFPVGCVL